MFCHSMGIPIHVVVGASSGSQGWRRVLCHPSVGLNRVVFPVSWVGWVSNEVAGLQRCVDAYFAGIPFHSPRVS
jgi:hypothetical protein